MKIKKIIESINSKNKNIFILDKFFNSGVLSEQKKEEYADKYQKDWIIYNKKDIFCIAITDDGSGNAKLIEFVNFWDISPEKMRDVTTMGYSTMLDAAINREKYEYIIADHTFDKSDVDTKYWRNLVGSNDKIFWSKKGNMNVSINIKEFESTMAKLLPKKTINYKNTMKAGKLHESLTTSVFGNIKE